MHSFLSHWEPLWELLVAVGTIGLAACTWRLARKTRDLASETAAAVALEERKVSMSLEPLVFPETPVVEGIRSADRDAFVYLRNGGPGVALDVRGKVKWMPQNGGESKTSETVTVTIAGGEVAQTPLMPPVGNWNGATGEVRYHGLPRERGVLISPEWLTTFEFLPSQGGVGCRVTGVIDVTRSTVPTS